MAWVEHVVAYAVDDVVVVCPVGKPEVVVWEITAAYICEVRIFHLSPRDVAAV